MLAWFEEEGREFATRFYLEDPLSVPELGELHALLGVAVSEWTRSGEPVYAETGLTSESSDEDHIAGIAAHPILMQRPICISAGKAIVCRPNELVTQII
ncbi:MAG: arsenate reductase [Planctomycetota bacterium]|jgi:arsenate reductase